jgi:hypothetical protein
MTTPMRQVLLAGVPIAALLARLRTPSGERMQEDVTEIVASFVPRSLAFGSLPFPRSGALSLDEMRERIHRFISAGEFDGYSRPVDGRIEWDFQGHYKVLAAYGIEILMSVGLEDRVTLQSIFSPPVVDMARYRASAIAFEINLTLIIFHDTWVQEHGPSPAASVFHDEMEAWHTLSRDPLPRIR